MATTEAEDVVGEVIVKQNLTTQMTPVPILKYKKVGSPVEAIPEPLKQLTEMELVKHYNETQALLFRAQERQTLCRVRGLENVVAIYDNLQNDLRVSLMELKGLIAEVVISKYPELETYEY